MSRLLMLAFHFPPAAAGSGPLRALGFARYLPAQGWEPTILTATPRAYSRTASSNDVMIPEGCAVHRVPALDVQRHLSIRGKYPGFLAQPDRWSSWWPGAVWKGLQLIRRNRIDAIWSTYPIMTAHSVAYALQAMTHLPWIADFRDPVSRSVEAVNQFSVRSQLRWERRVLRRASKVVLTTPGAHRAYAGQYPEAEGGRRLTVIQNGFDEADFEKLPPADSNKTDGPLVLLHSGVLYPDGRDPSAFFAALAELKRTGRASPGKLRVVLRASGCESRYQEQLERLGIADLVTLAPPVANHDALAEQARADGLLLFQGSRFDCQIPAKLYEYLRIGKPIFALVGPNGDTAALLREAGAAEPVALDDVAQISERFGRFVERLTNDTGAGGGPLDVARWSRQHRSAELAALLDELVPHAIGARSCA